MKPDEKIGKVIGALYDLTAHDLDYCTEENLAQLLYQMEKCGASARLKLWGRLSRSVHAGEVCCNIKAIEPTPPETKPCPKCSGEMKAFDIFDDVELQSVSLTPSGIEPEVLVKKQRKGFRCLDCGYMGV